MIDTHAHLNFPEFEDDLDEVITKSFESGIERLVIPGSDAENSSKALEIARKYENVFAAVGIHPHYTREDFSQIEKLAQNERVVAIGECGLDYFRLENKADRGKQKDLFAKHLDLAEKLDRPLIFHNRESEDDFYEIIKDRKVRGVVHCYTSTPEFAKKILDLGFLISFTGIITFDKTGNLEEVIKSVPLEKIMVETDSPLLAPVPYRGKRAQPWMVKEIIQKIADIKGLSFEEVDSQTTTNAKSFFEI